jgi:hypothetical protein
MKPLSPRAIECATTRTLLVVDEPDAVARQALAAGATERSAVNNEHGWRLGRIIDPFGHDGRSVRLSTRQRWSMERPSPLPGPPPAPTGGRLEVARSVST